MKTDTARLLQQSHSSQFILLPQAPSERVFILRDKISTAIVAKEECIRTASVDLKSEDSDLTIEFLRQHYEPEELTGRAQATRDFLNSGHGPRELFNVYELANFLKAHVDGREQQFKELKRTWPVPEKNLKEALLRQLSGFSSLDSWASIVTAAQDKRVIVPHHASLSASLLYLGHKGVLPDFDRKPIFLDQKNSYRSINADSVLIFDPLLQDLLKNDQKFRQACQNNKVKVIVPVGLHHGITAFGTDIDQIGSKLDAFTEQVWDKIKTVNTGAESFSVKEIAAVASAEMFKNTIGSFEQQTGLSCIPIYSGHTSKPEVSKVFVDQVVVQAFDPEILRTCLELSPGYQSTDLRHVLVSLLISQLHIYEQDRFRTLLKKVDEFFKDQMGQGKDMFIVLPENGKSFGYIASLYAQYFGFPVDKIISIDQVDLYKNQKQSMFVVLDDLSATGGSLVDAHKEFKQKNLQGEVCYFPLICTEEVVQRFSRLLAEEPQYSFASVDMIQSLGNSTFWKSLDGTTRARISSDLGRLGYGHLGLAVVLPHSVPNNNVELLEPGSAVTNLVSFARQDNSRELRME